MCNWIILEAIDNIEWKQGSVWKVFYENVAYWIFCKQFLLNKYTTFECESKIEIGSLINMWSGIDIGSYKLRQIFW